MKTKKMKIFVIFALLAGAAIFMFMKSGSHEESGELMREVTPARGTIRTFISTTGTVLPKNRLEIKPPVNGRIDKILVKEGELVEVGQTLAWMSSTERAALLDAARSQEEENYKYWQEAYKPIGLLAPINGEVIVATMQPGQTVTTADAVVVLSDQLIVRAQVDETDIGKVRLDQEAIVALDAYPDIQIEAKVEHIYYESETVNNVTIYKVDLLPEETPEFFRSGMNATVDFIEQSKENILLVPVGAVYKEKGEDYCLVKQDNGAEPLKKVVTLGVSDDKNVEILSGLSERDRLILKYKKYSLPKNDTATNPFLPSRKK